MAQRKRAGLITRRTADRNRPLLCLFALFGVLVAQEFALSRCFDFWLFCYTYVWGEDIENWRKRNGSQTFLKQELGR